MPRLGLGAAKKLWAQSEGAVKLFEVIGEKAWPEKPSGHADEAC
jgi:hypothetical protein